MPKLFRVTCEEFDTGYPNPLYSVELTLDEIKKLRGVDYCNEWRVDNARFTMK